MFLEFLLSLSFCLGFLADVLCEISDIEGSVDEKGAVIRFPQGIGVGRLRRFFFGGGVGLRH